LERVGIELPRDPLGRLDFTKRIPMTEDRLRALEGLKVELPYEALRRELNTAAGGPRLEMRSLVHGDLHFRHLILKEDKTLSGLIDWGDLHLNDPALDLQIYWSFFPPEARR